MNHACAIATTTLAALLCSTCTSGDPMRHSDVPRIADYRPSAAIPLAVPGEPDALRRFRADLWIVKELSGDRGEPVLPQPEVAALPAEEELAFSPAPLNAEVKVKYGSVRRSRFLKVAVPKGAPEATRRAAIALVREAIARVPAEKAAQREAFSSARFGPGVSVGDVDWVNRHGYAMPSGRMLPLDPQYLRALFAAPGSGPYPEPIVCADGVYGLVVTGGAGFATMPGDDERSLERLHRARRRAEDVARSLDCSDRATLCGLCRAQSSTGWRVALSRGRGTYVGMGTARIDDVELPAQRYDVEVQLDDRPGLELPLRLEVVSDADLRVFTSLLPRNSLYVRGEHCWLDAHDKHGAFSLWADGRLYRLDLRTSHPIFHPGIEPWLPGRPITNVRLKDVLLPVLDGNQVSRSSWLAVYPRLVELLVKRRALAAR